MEAIEQSLKSQKAFALFEDTKSPQHKHFLFTQPYAEIIAHKPFELKAAFEKIQNLSQKGYYLCGYMAYEAGYDFIDKPIKHEANFNQPLLYFMAFSHKQNYTPPQNKGEPVAIYDFSLSQNRDDYIKNIEKIKTYIQNGDTYQVNYTLKSRFGFTGDLLNLYAQLKAKQPVEYGAFFFFPHKKILSFSPELFIKKSGSIITSQPMKGTAKRGQNKAEDKAIIAAMLQDEKTLAENLMIVDLMRNDLSRFCKIGSVKTHDLFEVKTYKSLHQMVSTITGELKEKTSLYDIFQNIFPCGSITGAPKIRTMEIITELENNPRDVYTGALGYILPNQDFCFNIPIRTLNILSENTVEMGIGSGIVYDSQPRQEYEECLLKAQFLKNLNQGFYLFETMQVQNTHISLLERHLNRLEASARLFGFAYNRRAIMKEIDAKLKDLLGLYRMKLCLFFDGQIRIQYMPFAENNNLAKITLSHEIVKSDNLWLYHKTSHRNFYEKAYEKAQEQGFDDVIFCNEKGELTEASRHNIYIEQQGQLYTPPLESGLLPGVFRQKLLDSKQAIEKTLTPKDLQKADKIYISNGLHGLREARAILE